RLGKLLEAGRAASNLIDLAATGGVEGLQELRATHLVTTCLRVHAVELLVPACCWALALHELDLLHGLRSRARWRKAGETVRLAGGFMPVKRLVAAIEWQDVQLCRSDIRKRQIGAALKVTGLETGSAS